jgi:hypothetical protein
MNAPEFFELQCADDVVFILFQQPKRRTYVMVLEHSLVIVQQRNFGTEQDTRKTIFHNIRALTIFKSSIAR